MPSRFFCDHFTAHSTVTLSREDSHHLVRVLRIKRGEVVTIIDGKGNVATGTVSNPDPKGTEVEVGESSRTPAQSSIVLGFGIPKGPAQDFIFRRATELGLLGFQAIGTEHSLKAQDFNEERWLRVIPEVAKQCEETVFPHVFPALNLEKTLAQYPGKTVFFCDEAQRQSKPNQFDLPRATPKLLLIGPEGGWSTREREQILGHGVQILSLGINRLRAETACLVGLALLKERLGEINRD